MRSHPVIQQTLSQTQTQLTCLVERHATASRALFELDGDASLPGDTVRLSHATRSVPDNMPEHRHTIEFMALTGDGHWNLVGSIGHSQKELNAMRGGYHLIESTYEVTGPGIPRGWFRHAEVEAVVQRLVEKLVAARLLPLSSGHPARATSNCAV